MFEGFPQPQQNYSKLPHVMIDALPIVETLAELKCILYILRHTWGYSEFDKLKTMTTDEFMRGRKRRDGSRMDSGTGLSNKSVVDGLKRAIAHNFIELDTNGNDKARIKKSYKIKIRYVDSTYPAGDSTYPAGDSTQRTEKETLERNLEERTKDSPPTAGGEPAPRPRDEVFDAVALHIFEQEAAEAEGGRIAKISNWLKGTYDGKGKERMGKISKPAEVAHIEKFAAYCKDEGFTPPLDFVKFVEQWRKWASRQRTAPTTAPALTLEEYDAMIEQEGNDAS